MENETTSPARHPRLMKLTPRTMTTALDQRLGEAAHSLFDDLRLVGDEVDADAVR